jgi:hypothetical protein
MCPLSRLTSTRDCFKCGIFVGPIIRADLAWPGPGLRLACCACPVLPAVVPSKRREGNVQPGTARQGPQEPGWRKGRPAGAGDGSGRVVAPYHWASYEAEAEGPGVAEHWQRNTVAQTLKRGASESQCCRSSDIVTCIIFRMSSCTKVEGWVPKWLRQAKTNPRLE